MIIDIYIERRASCDCGTDFDANAVAALVDHGVRPGHIDPRREVECRQTIRVTSTIEYRSHTHMPPLERPLRA